MKLEFPNEKHKLAYEKLIKRWWKSEKIPTDHSALFRWDNFEEFLGATEKDIYDSERLVNAHLFFLIEQDDILWYIQIRHHINHPNLIEKWWHIWYLISPDFRRKWYGTKILELWLVEAKKLWLDKILITCDLNNIWSNKIIEKNWWVFERKTKDWEKNRYWVEL